MLKTKWLIIFSLLVSFYISACSSCKKSSNENMITGVITVVGNEPFTKLAVLVDDSKVYVLECDDELKQKLWSQQGNAFTIKFSESREEAGQTILMVENAMPLNDKHD